MHSFTLHMHADALICTHATALCYHVAAVAVNSFNKRCTQMPTRCWSLMGNEPFCLAAGTYTQAWQVVMVHLRYIQGGDTHWRYLRGGTRRAAVILRTILVKQMQPQYHKLARARCSLTQSLKLNCFITRKATIVISGNVVYQTKHSILANLVLTCVLWINIYLICMIPKNSQANISSSSIIKSHSSPLILFYSPPATVCGWQAANLLYTCTLPEGMDRRSALNCTIENNNSFLLLTNTHTKADIRRD